MKTDLYHEIDNDPELEDVGIIRIVTRIFGEDDNLTFSTVSLAKDFINDVNDECKSKEDLNYFLLEAGVDEDVVSDALMKLIVYVDEVTCPASIEYSPDCALDIKLDLVPDDDDDRIEEVVQVSFPPVNKLVVKSLTRRIYNKKIEKKKKKISFEECVICLEEFMNGSKVMTLPCGHEFDDECIVKWFETSHVCPLCRFELQCERSMN